MNRQTLRKVVLAPLLLGYMALLILAAWTDPVRPGFANGIQGISERVLLRYNIRAGIPVYHGGEKRDSKHKAQCVVVVGHDERGRLRMLHEQLDECGDDGPFFRFVADRYDLALQLVVNFSIQSKQHAPGRSQAALATLADYFCHSPLVANRGIEQVSTIVVRVRKSYSSGQVTKRSRLIHHWSCEANRVEPRPWPVSLLFELGLPI